MKINGRLVFHLLTSPFNYFAFTCLLIRGSQREELIRSDNEHNDSQTTLYFNAQVLVFKRRRLLSKFIEDVVIYYCVDSIHVLCGTFRRIVSCIMWHIVVVIFVTFRRL